MKNIILLLIFTVASGCGPTYYVPNSQNIPIMKTKGQTNLYVGLNVSENTDGFEVQGAYGLTDKIALQINGDWSHNDYEQDSNSYNLIEGGVGYYKNLNPSFVFETYALLGFGGIEYKETFDGYNFEKIKADILRLGLQPSISFTSKHFTSSFSTRLANLNYNNISGNLTSYNEGFYYETDYLKANNSQWVVEPAFTLQTGFENFKLQLQYVRSFNLTDSWFSQDYDLISIGLKLNLMPKTK